MTTARNDKRDFQGEKFEQKTAFHFLSPSIALLFWHLIIIFVNFGQYCSNDPFIITKTCTFPAMARLSTSFFFL